MAASTDDEEEGMAILRDWCRLEYRPDTRMIPGIGSTTAAGVRSSGMSGSFEPDESDPPGGGGQPPWFAPPLWLATGGGIGRAPRAPGTAGSVVGILLSLATGAVAEWTAGLGASAALQGIVEACVIVMICLAGVPICTRAAALLGRGKDPGAIVFDELAAVPLVLLPIPPATRSIACLVSAFVLFRIFDIAKPFPCRRLERLPAGWGIMADDWAAAAWAAAALALMRAAGLV